MRVKTAQFDSTIKPQFKKTPRGLLLSSYQAIYRGATPAEATDLGRHQRLSGINGLQFPQEISLTGSYGKNAFKVNFTSRQTTKH
jgi:hypothetical protein